MTGLLLDCTGQLKEMGTYIISAPFWVFPLLLNPLPPEHHLIGRGPKFISAIFRNFLRNSLKLTVHKPADCPCQKRYTFR